MICKNCQIEFESIDSLRRHNSRVHKISSKEFYIEYVLSGITPTCKCGCGEGVKFLDSGRGFSEFKWGHASRIHNNWGHNPEAVKKSHTTQKILYNTGVLTVWNKGLTVDDPRVRDNIDKVMANPDRGVNISKKLSGVSKSVEHIQNLSKSAINTWKDPNKRIGQSERKIKWMSEHNFIKSKTEDLFEKILNEGFNLQRNVDYACQYYVKDIKGFYDFYLFDKKTLIEVDGDFWHCNPEGKYKIPQYDAQYINLLTDAKKNKWAVDNNIPLIRFWESDINNNPDLVISRLKEIL